MLLCRSAISAIRQYHCSGRVVYVICTHVTLAVIRLHNAGQASIQRYMSLGICGKHKQVRSTRTPTDFLLTKIRWKGKAVNFQTSAIFDCVMYF